MTSIATLPANRQLTAVDESLSELSGVLLVNFVHPADLPIYTEIGKAFGRFRVLTSTTMDANRDWRPNFGELDVRVQRTLTLERPWKHPEGFVERNFVHIPYDTTKQLREFAPDVVISKELGARSAAAAWYAKRSGAALVLWANLSEHTEQGRGAARAWLRKRLVKRAHALVVNGRSGGRYLQALGADENRLRYAPYAAAGTAFADANVSRDAIAGRRLLYVGQLNERKGIEPAVAAIGDWVRKHPHRRVELWIAGDGPARENLERTDLPENFSLKLLGSCSYEQLAEAYAQCGVLLFPTLADEWGLVVHEALASGLPVVGSRYAQAVEELVAPGVNGWQYRPDQLGELQATLDDLFAMEEVELDAMRSAAREAVAHITPEFVASQVLQAASAAAREGSR